MLFDGISKKVFSGERLSRDEGIHLLKDADLLTLDFSNFIVLVHEEMPDDVAFLMTWCMGETAEAIERQYRHIPAERSPVGYPLDPERMRMAPIPLHPAADRYYSTRTEEGP